MLTKAKLREQVAAGDYDDVLASGGGLTESEVNALIGAAISAARLAENPIGTILSNTSATNPGTYIGGTWAAWGSGRVPVGVDAAQTEFNTVEKTGGAKTHALTEAQNGPHAHNPILGNGAGTYTTAQIAANLALFGTSVPSSSSGSGSPHNNLQPYITCYMWKRTA